MIWKPRLGRVPVDRCHVFEEVIAGRLHGFRRGDDVLRRDRDGELVAVELRIDGEVLQRDDRRDVRMRGEDGFGAVEGGRGIVHG